MESTSCVFLLLVLAVSFCCAAKLPENFKQCKQRDDQHECLKPAIENALRVMKNGIPSLQLLPTDPLDVSKITIEEGGNRPISLKMDLLNSKLEGLGTIIVNGVRYNLTQRFFDVEVTVPKLQLTGGYIMDGRFLLLPLKGKGKCTLTLTKFKTNFVLKAVPAKKNKEIYWHVTGITLKIYDVSNFRVNFDNLFNGDKILGASTNKALNDNWPEFWEVIRPSIEVAFGEIFTSVANVIFSRVAEKDIFIQ